MNKKQKLEASLTEEQRKAALMLVEAQLGDEMGISLTQEEIAQSIGVTRMTLYRWRTQNDTFVDYMNCIASDFLKAKQGQVFRQLMKSINSQQPSVKGIELFLKLQGILKDVNVVETRAEERSEESIERSLDELDDLLNEE